MKNDEKNLSTNKGSSIITINDNNKFQFWSCKNMSLSPI